MVLLISIIPHFYETVKQQAEESRTQSPFSLGKRLPKKFDEDIAGAKLPVDMGSPEVVDYRKGAIVELP